MKTGRDLLLYLDCHKSMELDGIHLRVLRELVDMIANLLSIISVSGQLEMFQRIEGLSMRLSPIHKKEEDPENNRPANLFVDSREGYRKDHPE